MTLSDPRDAFADQSSFLGYLVGLAGMARVVRTLAADGTRAPDPPPADDFVHVLLGLAGVGVAIERIADTAVGQPNRPSDTTTARWLR